MDEEKITVAFLDVGQGDSTVVILPNSSNAVVVDCPLKPVTINYLEHKRINNLHVFLTHTDLDHMGGISELVENFEQVHTLAYNHDTCSVAKDEGEDLNKRQIILRHLAQLIERRGIETYSPRTGDRWLFQGVEVETLHPHARDIKRAVPHGDTNNASIMLRLTFAQRRVLLTADIGGEGWKWVVERNTDLKADILKFPHHGAWYNAIGQQPALEKILVQIDPNLVVLSVGTRNIYHHPKLNTFKLLRSHPQLRFICTEATDQCYSALKATHKGTFPCAGTVEVVIEKDEITVTPDLAQHSAVIKHFDSAQCKTNS